MIPTGKTGGWFRRLWHGDEEALLEHYMRLSPADLRLRFLHAVSDEFLACQARKLGGAGYDVTGWFSGGTLRGVVEVAMDGRATHARAAEASFSVEAPWRNLGVGHGLMRRALRRARQAGCRSLTVLTAWDNAPMIRLARESGARISARDGEVLGELTPGRADWAELGFEAADDRIGLLGAASEVLWAMAAAHPWLGAKARPGGGSAAGLPPAAGTCGRPCAAIASAGGS